MAINFSSISGFCTTIVIILTVASASLNDKLNSNHLNKIIFNGSASDSGWGTSKAKILSQSKENQIQWIKFMQPQQDDPILLEIVRNSILIPPIEIPDNINQPDWTLHSQDKQNIFIPQIFGNKMDGFFVACCGLDEEKLSNTLVLERYFSWRGLLIEADPTSFESLKKQHRKSWIAHSCLSTSKFPRQVRSVNASPMNSQGKSLHHSSPRAIDLQCIPIGTYLLALGISNVDYMSLDGGVSDFEVLKTIPYEKIQFNVVKFEVQEFDKSLKSKLKSFMKNKGYKFYGAWKLDYIFIHHSFSSIPFKKLKLKSFNKGPFNTTDISPPQKMKRILLWTTIYRHRSLKDWRRHTGIPRNNHKCNFKCKFTTKMSKLNISDAVIYHSWPEFKGSMYPLPRRISRKPNQVWVYLAREPALYHSRIYDRLNDSYEFNWTMTYRTDSDIHIPYGRIEKIQMSKSTRRINKLIVRKAFSKNKKNYSLAAAMISNCKAPSGRDQYIKQLRKIISIDLYGACGNLSCQGDFDFYNSPFRSDCYKELGQKYKFWLSFENTLCPDYVTEKLYFPLQYGSLPIYLGYPEYPKNLPKHSFIHTKDFKTPKQLGEYILYLDTNPKEYLKYFEWRKNFQVIMDEEQPVAWCTLCQKLHEIHPGNHKNYKRIADWFLRNNTEKSICINPNKRKRKHKRVYALKVNK